MKPSAFSETVPFDSTFHKMEHERIAKNIMVILARTGDIFRDLTWEEYKEERLKDKNFSESEKHYFEEVLSYTANEERARCFSPAWTNVYIFELNQMIDKIPTMYSREQVKQLFNDYCDYRNSEEMHNGEEPMEFDKWLNKQI